MNTPDGNARLAYILLPVAALCWAGNHVLARAIAWHVPPAGLSVLRWALVAIVIAALYGPTLKADRASLRRKPVTMILLAIAGGALFGTMQFVGLLYTTAINVGVLNSAAPALIAAASFLIFGDRLGFAQVTGILVSFLGVVAIISQLDLDRLLSLSLNGGDIIILANMLLWAVYSACLRLRPQVSGVTFLFAMSVVSSLANIPFAIFELGAGFQWHADLLTVFAVLYTGLATSLIAYLCWQRGVELIGPGRAGVFLHLIPPFGICLAVSLLGEPLRGYHIVGFVLILAGVALAARPQTQAARQTNPTASV